MPRNSECSGLLEYRKHDILRWRQLFFCANGSHGAKSSILGSEQAQTLTEAFELALELRIVHQLDQIAAGHTPDDLLDAAAMSPLTRGRLRDVFRAVGTVARELRPA